MLVASIHTSKQLQLSQRYRDTVKNRAECHQNCSQLGVLNVDLLMYKENLFHKSSPNKVHILQPFQDLVKQITATKCVFLSLGLLSGHKKLI